jgi:hypothetical protein
MVDLISLLTHDAFATCSRHLTPRDMLLLSMTTKAADKIFDNNDIWLDVYHLYFAARLPNDSYRREYKELETKPKQHQLATRARYFCGLMSFNGCQHCMSRRIRKIYMPFMLRLCELCFNDATIQERFVCAATGFDSLTHIRELGIDLSALPHRGSFYDFTWSLVLPCLMLAFKRGKKLTIETQER